MCDKSMQELHLQPYKYIFGYNYYKVSFSFPYTTDHDHASVLKKSIICMTSLMHHVHVNHLEQESTTHINGAHHAC